MVFKVNTILVPVGEIDLEMLSALRMKHPGVTVDNEVVEPSPQQLHNYKGTVFIGTHSHIFSILLLNNHIHKQYVFFI